MVTVFQPGVLRKKIGVTGLAPCQVMLSSVIILSTYQFLGELMTYTFIYIRSHCCRIIWADTLFVGCGKAKCRDTEWEYTLVCNYGPGYVHFHFSLINSFSSNTCTYSGNIGNGFQSPYAIPYQSA